MGLIGTVIKKQILFKLVRKCHNYFRIGRLSSICFGYFRGFLGINQGLIRVNSVFQRNKLGVWKVKLELKRIYQGHKAADSRFSNLVIGHFILLRFGTRLGLNQPATIKTRPTNSLLPGFRCKCPDLWDHRLLSNLSTRSTTSLCAANCSPPSMDLRS